MENKRNTGTAGSGTVLSFIVPFCMFASPFRLPTHTVWSVAIRFRSVHLYCYKSCYANILLLNSKAIPVTGREGP
jgi:hypothetical protein